MVSFVLEVDRLFVALDFPTLNLLHSISLAQFCSQAGLRVLNTAKEDKVQYASSVKDSELCLLMSRGAKQSKSLANLRFKV